MVIADEAIERRHAHGAQRRQQKNNSEDGHDLHQPAVFGNLARVPPLVDDAHDEEEHAGGRQSTYLLLSNTTVEVNSFPSAFLPLRVSVSVLPPFETTVRPVA